MYPERYLHQREVYYKYEKNSVLEASPGLTYSWEPMNNLSAYTIRAPYMTGYTERYTVTVHDRFNCPFQELFHILLQCDTLYPKKSILVADTLLDEESYRLIPKYGWPSSEWTPGRFLECVVCDSPLASPQVSTTYSVQLQDDFGCSHEEVFRLEVPLKVPNTITPNEDGFNDKLIITGLPDHSFLYIYTKSGELVYSVKAYSNDEGWSGTDNAGKLLETGTYWYVLGHDEYGTLKTGYIFVKR
jgi:gliding motility-associated-like protein